jgi:hypothetical protein
MRMLHAVHILAATVVTCLWTLGADPALQAGDLPSWDVASDFCPTSNPCGAWSYGWSATAGSAFTLYTQPLNVGIDTWSDPSLGSLEPDDFHNGTLDTVTPACCNPIPPGTAGFHPGPNGENSVFRWTAPTSGLYTITATFTGRDEAGTTTNVAVLYGCVPIFTGLINGYLDTKSFSSSVFPVFRGQTINFTVGFGPNESYASDSTGLNARITLLRSMATKAAAAPQDPGCHGRGRRGAR